MEEMTEMESIIIESVGNYMEDAKDEIMNKLVNDTLTESGSITLEQKDFFESIVDNALIEMSTSLIPDEAELELTENDFVITESGDLYFVDGDSLEFITEGIEIEYDEDQEVMIENQENQEETTEVEEAVQAETEEEIVTESADATIDEIVENDGVDSIVSRVMARINQD